jgi:tetratricopeptide (TPR) repeat protein
MTTRLLFLGLFLAVIMLPAPAAGQQLADELTRREALQHYRTGQEFLSAERFEDAATAFQKAIDTDRLLALAHYGLGQSYMALRRYASAVAAYRGCRDAYVTLAGLAQSDAVTVDRQRQEEIRELRESIRLFQSGTIKTGTPDRTIHIVKLESRIRDLERMQQRGLTVLPVPAEVSLALGSAHFRNGDAVDAEREWKAAVGVNPRLGEAHNNLAALYALSGRKREAEAAVRAAERAGFRVHPQLKEDIRRMST